MVQTFSDFLCPVRFEPLKPRVECVEVTAVTSDCESDMLAIAVRDGVNIETAGMRCLCAGSTSAVTNSESFRFPSERKIDFAFCELLLSARVPRNSSLSIRYWQH